MCVEAEEGEGDVQGASEGGEGGAEKDESGEGEGSGDTMGAGTPRPRLHTGWRTGRGECIGGIVVVCGETEW